MKIKIFYVACFVMCFLTSCGGGSGGSSGPNNSSKSNSTSSVPTIGTFTTGNKPGSVFIRTAIGSVEIFPTMIVTIDFKSNIDQADLNKLSVVMHISADDNSNYMGQEFAYVFEQSKAVYKWTYVDIKEYCCQDSTDTYYQATNAPGFLRLTLYHYGRHTAKTWNNLQAGTFHMNVDAKFYGDSTFSSIISNDYLPARELFTTYGLSFTDEERDYLGNDGSADISAVNVEMFFD